MNNEKYNNNNMDKIFIDESPIYKKEKLSLEDIPTNECKSDYISSEEVSTPTEILEDISNLLIKLIEEQTITNSKLTELNNALSPSAIIQRFDSGIQTLSTAVASTPSYDDVSTTGYTQLKVNTVLERNAPKLFVLNIGPGALYIRSSRNGNSFTEQESIIYESGVKVFYDIYELRLRTPIANTKYIATEFDTDLGQTYSSLGSMIEKDALAVNGGNLPANGSAVEFDITEFSNIAKINQITITQLTAGVANYTFEIWEKDGDGYNPAVRADLYLRVYERDFIVSEDSDLILEPGILYIDRDNTKELHCRVVNNVGGTASDFDVSIKAFGNSV